MPSSALSDNVPVATLPANTLRLALGIEPREAWRGGRVTHPIRVQLETGPGPYQPVETSKSYRGFFPPWAARPGFDRHASGRHALLYHPALSDSVLLRLYDHHRRYVPRRLRVPLLAESSLPSVARRVRRPSLFPGANHDLVAGATGLRGQVLRAASGGQALRPARWARVEALLDAATVVARAQADDRGEFLLLLPPEATQLSGLEEQMNLQVSVAVPATEPVAIDAAISRLDPFWDLPEELLPPAVDSPQPDPVAAGLVPPNGYVSSISASRQVSFSLAQVISNPPFIVP